MRLETLIKLFSYLEISAEADWTIPKHKKTQCTVDYQAQAIDRYSRIDKLLAKLDLDFVEISMDVLFHPSELDFTYIIKLYDADPDH